MRASLVLCVAAVFHTVFVTSRSEEIRQIEMSTTTRHVERKADYTRSLHDQISMTPVSYGEENDYKRKGRVYYPLRIKRRTTHRPRTKSNAKLRNLTRSDTGTTQQADHASIATISNETDLYEYESVDVESLSNRTGNTAADADVDATQIYVSESLDTYYSFHGGFKSLLTRLIETLENNSREDDDDPDKPSSRAIDDVNRFDDEDRCQKWLNNWEKIERAFPGSVADLPACPCLYPNSIFYNNQIWDRKRERKFRWRDVSHAKDRLAIYKPGAVYCVQTLPSQENESAIVQHCCYDENRRLLTRGSGAGTPYIVSPDISLLLHDKIDLLPWRLCKGDFTRYNEVRIPNNDNNCEINPDNEEYQRQVERAKNY